MTDSGPPPAATTKGITGNKSQRVVESDLISQNSFTTPASSSERMGYAAADTVGQTTSSQIEEPPLKPTERFQNERVLPQGSQHHPQLPLHRATTTLPHELGTKNGSLHPYPASVFDPPERRRSTFDQPWYRDNTNTEHYSSDSVTLNESSVTLHSSPERSSSSTRNTEQYSSGLHNHSSTHGPTDHSQRPATADGLSQFYPPRRILPFPRRPTTSYVEVREDVPHPPQLSSTLNLPPLPAPSFRSEAYAGTVLGVAPMRGIVSNLLRSAPTEASAGARGVEPRVALRSIEANPGSAARDFQPVLMNRSGAAPRPFPETGEAMNGVFLHGSSKPQNHHPASIAESITNHAVMTAMPENPTYQNVATLTMDQERLRSYATQTTAMRQAALDQLIRKYIHDDDFLVLCQDLENSWRRVGFHREN